MRRFTTALITLALSVSGLVFSPAKAAVPINGNYSCASGVKDGAAPRFIIAGGVVSGGGSCTGAVAIPTGVTSIGNEAFLRAEQLTSITIPASVTSIGAGAFQQTSSLKSINIPEGITTIPDRTFLSAASLRNITIPASVETIGQEAFRDTPRMASVTFQPGSQLKTIGDLAFYETRSLTSITIPAGVTSIGNLAFGEGPLEEIFFLGLTAPSVNAAAFTGIEGSPKAKIKSGATGFTATGDPARWNGLEISEVTDLGSYGCASGMKDAAGTKYEIFGGQVFNGRSCSGSVVLPANVTSIGANAFSGASISSITIPSGVTRIEGNAFSGSSISSITIPASVTTLGQNAFGSSNNLTTVTFAPGATLKAIGDEAFRELGALTNITIPEKVASIGSNAFLGASALTSITVVPGNETFSSIDGVLINKSTNTVVQYPIGKTASSYSIPNTITEIGNDAFRGATSLTSITIPSSVTWINSDAFRETGLTSISIPAAVLGIAERAFQDSALTTVTFEPNSELFVVGTNAFQLSQRITTITIPASVVYVDSGAFSAFDSITIESGTRLEPMQSASWTPNCTGCTFGGWSTTQDGSTTITFPYTPSTSSSTTLYAKWTTWSGAGTPGSTPNSKVVSIPARVTEATIPGSDALPAIKLNLAGASGQADVTVAPISNPDPANSPFKAGVSAKIVDINVYGITGRVTVCLDGGAGENLFHFTGGVWVALPERSYVNGQVCGVTSSFSPFTAAIPSKTPAVIASEAAAAAAAAAEQARIAAAAAAELASRTISAKKSYSTKALAKRVGVPIVARNASVTVVVANGSKKVCAQSQSKLETSKAGRCVLTFTVQEPAPRALKVTKSLVIGNARSGSTWKENRSYSIAAIATGANVSRSSKAKLTMSVSKSSKDVCFKSGLNLKMLKPGTCNVTFTVQEPTPKATKTTKTFVVK